MTPEETITDLEQYLMGQRITLSPEVKSIFIAIEKVAYDFDTDMYMEHVLLGLICSSHLLRNLMIQHGGDPETATKVIINKLRQVDPSIRKICGNYQTVLETSYSSRDNRKLFTRSGLLDLCIEACRNGSRNIISETDLIAALLDYHNECFPVIENSLFNDEKLKVPFQTLAHIEGHYDKSLWVSFDVVRSELGLSESSTSRNLLVDLAPSHVRPALISFLLDFPDYLRNAFLIMPFKETTVHTQVFKTLRTVFSEYGFRLHRADDCSYSDDLLTNIEAYIYGCKFGVAVYERVLEDVPNPNVAFEVGYMIALKKPVCLLKEKTVKALHSDLTGRVFVEFDTQGIKSSIKTNISKWLRDKRLIRPLNR